MSESTLGPAWPVHACTRTHTHKCTDKERDTERERGHTYLHLLHAVYSEYLLAKNSKCSEKLFLMYGVKSHDTQLHSGIKDVSSPEVSVIT